MPTRYVSTYYPRSPNSNDDNTNSVNSRNRFGTEFGVEEPSELTHNTHVFQDIEIHMNYFKIQKKFIQSLNKEEKAILASYTKYGDRLINGMLRNKWDESTLFQYITNLVKEDFDKVFQNIFANTLTEKNCYSEIVKYVNKFQEVFQKVPELEKPMRVFRGISTSEHYNPKVEGLISPTIDFLSATYDPLDGTLHDYSKDNIMEFIIQPGVRVLWVEPISYFRNEREIIIENNVKLRAISVQNKHLLYYENNDNPEYRIIEVFELEVKPNKTIYKSITGFLNQTRTVLYKKCFTRKRKRT